MGEAEIIQRNKDTDKIFKKIKEICDDYLDEVYPAAPDPDHYTGQIQDQLKEYDQIWGNEPEPQKEPQIIIVVEGGVIQAVHSNTPIEYRIIDIDDVKELNEKPTDAIGNFSNFENDSIFEDIEAKTKEIIQEV